MTCNCERCLKKFPDKSKLKQHLLRKKICNIYKNGKDITYKEIWNNIFKDIDYDNEYFKKNLSNNKNIEPNKIFICNSCSNILKHSSSYYRHIKNCKVSEKIKKIEDDIKEQTKLLSKLINIKNNDHVIYNTTNNTQNIYNQNNINISINNFGEEDLSHITDTFLKDIIYHMNNNAVIKYIQEVHFNNPSNTNIKILDNKTKFMMIKKNNEWILDNKSLILNGMINLNMNRIQKAYEDLEEDITENLKKEFEDYSKIQRIEQLEEICDSTENMILNNQKKLLLKKI